MNTLHCQNCQHPLLNATKFCGNCGKKVSFKKEALQLSSLRLVLVFYIVYLVFSFVSSAILNNHFSLITEICVESVFALLTVGFALTDYKNIYALYSFKLANWKNILFACVVPLVTVALVYWPIEWLNLFLVDEIDNVFYAYQTWPNMYFWVFVFYVIIPPIFEELAFRGFLFNQMLLISNWKVTILSTAFIFALIHFSLISFIWIFPFGILLGYLRYAYKTLWLGMIIHFLHNLFVVLLDYYYYNKELSELIF